MAILSISEAARAAGVARSTVQRAIKEGRLSATARPDGKKGIDTAELTRVFGEPATGARQPVRQTTRQVETAARGRSALQQQVDLLRQELDAARDRERWYQARIEQLEQRLLPPPKRGWIERLADALARLRGG